MKNDLKLKGISYSDKEINMDNLYIIFTDIIIEDIKRGDVDDKTYSSIA